MREIFEYELDNIDEVLSYIDNTEKMNKHYKKRLQKLHKHNKSYILEIVDKLINKYHNKFPDNIANVIRDYCFTYGIEVFTEDLFDPNFYTCIYKLKEGIIIYFNKDGYIIFEK